MNNELREKEISRDYHLKRAIIFLLIFATSPFLTVGNVFLFKEVVYPIWKYKVKSSLAFRKHSTDWYSEKTRKLIFPKITCWGGGVIVELLTTILPLILTIYHFYKFWKAHKECQELAHPSLTPETATESREREREREREI